MITSKITAKAQTTIPRGVRDALEVSPGDDLAYEIHRGYAIVRPVKRSMHVDPALHPFLSFIANDMAQRPEALRPVHEDLVTRIRDLVADVEVHADEPIEGDVAL